ncbi:MAG TPA: phosphate ABC transporter substrate-binding protein PstS [Pseudonocardiaceae bacterium]
MTACRSIRRRRWAALGTALLALLLTAPPAAAAAYVPISGAGSTWSFNALDAWRRNVVQYGLDVSYKGVGSTTGRNEFKDGTVDFAASDIPYGVQDGNNYDPPPARGFAYMPDTAGGTTFMYNLNIGGQRVTNLRLSGAVIAGIFTGVITRWNDPAIARDNPGLTMPAIQIIPVVRSDGSGATAQFTQWMLATQPSYWNGYCAKVGRSPCTQTSAYPVLANSAMVAQAGDLGVSGYVSQQQAVGAIGYVEYSYAIETGFPVAKMLNPAGYYTEPTAGHVAVSLLKAQINMDASNPNTYLTQNLSQVYVNPDPRSYPLSSYSYMILPTTSANGLGPDKGNTLGDFGKYLLCQGQNQVDALGYSALPINLVQAGFDQLRRIPGATIPNINIATCNNPTFSANGTNTLATTDPYPAACDHIGATQCTTGTGGARNQPTAGKPGTTGGAGGNGSGGSSRTGAGGSAAGANGSAAASSSAAAYCDPDTGCAASGSGAGAAAALASAVPLASANSLGDGLQVALMVVAALLLVAIVLTPPLISQLITRRRARRGDVR